MICYDNKKKKEQEIKDKYHIAYKNVSIFTIIKVLIMHDNKRGII